MADAAEIRRENLKIAEADGGENGDAAGTSTSTSGSGWGRTLDSLRNASGLITLCALLVALAILLTSFAARMEGRIMSHMIDQTRDIKLQIAASELRVTESVHILDAEIEELERELYDLGIRVSVIEQDRKKR